MEFSKQNQIQISFRDAFASWFWVLTEVTSVRTGYIFEPFFIYSVFFIASEVQLLRCPNTPNT